MRDKLIYQFPTCFDGLSDSPGSISSSYFESELRQAYWYLEMKYPYQTGEWKQAFGTLIGSKKFAIMQCIQTRYRYTKLFTGTK